MSDQTPQDVCKGRILLCTGSFRTKRHPHLILDIHTSPSAIGQQFVLFRQGVELALVDWCSITISFSTTGTVKWRNDAIGMRLTMSGLLQKLLKPFDLRLTIALVQVYSNTRPDWP
jgi:hypothetical protein